jgi:hypothetical protein
MNGWRPATDHPDENTHQVLVLWRKPFFGIYVLEPDVGFYDDPAGYTDGAGRGWCRWFGGAPLDVVYWMPIAPHDDLPYDKEQRAGDGDRLRERERR